MPGTQILNNCNSFDINKFNLTEAINNITSPQLIAFPKYNYNDEYANAKLIIKTGEIKITTYGIPTINGKYIMNDSDRNYIKIPHDPSQVSCNELFDMLEKIDIYMSKEETKKKIFGDNMSNMYQYVPLIKRQHILDDEDEDIGGYKKLKSDFCTVKFFKDNSTGNLKTSLFQKKYNGNVHLLNITSVSDVNEYLHYGSVARFAITITKMWAQKTAAQKGMLKQYGLILKCLQIVVNEPKPVYNNNNKYFENNYIFDDKDEYKVENENEDDIYKKKYKIYDI